jgi:hypothetical protein
MQAGDTRHKIHRSTAALLGDFGEIVQPNDTVDFLIYKFEIILFNPYED